jgi:hypothetical protein
LRQPLGELPLLPRSCFRFFGGLKLLLNPSRLDLLGALHDRANVRPVAKQLPDPRQVHVAALPRQSERLGFGLVERGQRFAIIFLELALGCLVGSPVNIPRVGFLVIFNRFGCCALRLGISEI